MALFGRKSLPHRSSLSRFLADVDRPCLEAFRTLFEQSSFAASSLRIPWGVPAYGTKSKRESVQVGGEAADQTNHTTGANTWEVMGSDMPSAGD